MFTNPTRYRFRTLAAPAAICTLSVVGPAAGANDALASAPPATRAGIPVANPVPEPIAFGSVHVDLEVVAAGLVAPNWGTTAPGDASRLFVVDQPGTLWAIDLETGAKSVFLDVASRLVPLGVFGPDTFDERGLLGAAFHPDYPVNGLLYTYTSEPVSGEADFSTMPFGTLANHQSVITEWQVPSPGDPASVVDPLSARELLRVDQPQFNHNAGALNFGPDGQLYIAFGDGGGADDRDGQIFIGVPIVGHGLEGNGRKITNPLGAILRIDPLGSNSANGRYGIPADNPYAQQDGVETQEIFASGFRNPFRFSFDQLDGTLWAADVGQNALEEIDIVVSGGDYGWNYKEGTFFFDHNGNDPGFVTNVDPGVPGDLIDPIAQYDHDEGLAIIGGFVYRGTKIEPLVGRYVFGEFARTFTNDGRLFYLSDGNEIVEFNLVGGGPLAHSLLGMGQDDRGEIYALVNETGTPFGATGAVLRIVTKPGDFDANGVVDALDFLALIGSWGACDGCPADIDDNGVVDALDFLTLLANWG